MSDNLDGPQLAALIRRVFEPQPDDRSIAVIVDLPDATTPDSPSWYQRRAMAAEWVAQLAPMKSETGLDAHLVLYRNVGTNNADLPELAWTYTGGPLPETADALDKGQAEPFSKVLQTHRLLLAPTKFSATAPLKLAAPQYGFRAATMPGFLPSMLPALKLDYGEINRRVMVLKQLLDHSNSAELVFMVDDGSTYDLTLDLRYRKAHASGGLLPKPGTAGNLPSGETYIVPYEGERDGEPSRSAGQLPVQFGDQVVVYEVKQNRAVSVEGSGPAAKSEAAKLRDEPAYGNMAELGLGVLDDFGVEPVGVILLDEKLGLHVAFGRSDHFGGQVGAAQFSSPAAVVHIDRVYVPAMQPRIHVKSATVQTEEGSGIALMQDDRYVLDFGTVSG